MLITFKTLQQKTFQIEIDENEKVLALKEKIAEDRGEEFPADCQKLIYAGKILNDEKTVKEYNIDTTKNFVVVMATKKEKEKDDESASGSSSETPSASTTAVTESTPATSQTETTASATTAESTTTDRTTDASGVETAESALLTGTALEASVTELMSLGYSREQVIRALNSSFHNADRAAEYLLSGNIPDIGGDEGGEGGDDAPPAVGDAVPSGGGGDGNDLSFLSSLPQFQLMRNQIRQNPSSLPQLLQEIGQANPQLLQLISQNQESFINLLNAPDGGDADQPAAGGGVSAQGGDAGAGFQVRVTPDEKKIIDNIVGMGFAEPDVIQAFFACEKNEQLTINFLLNQ